MNYLQILIRKCFQHFLVIILIYICTTVLSSTNVSAKYYSNLVASDFLSFQEIKSLLKEIKPDIKTVDKLGIILNTTFSHQANYPPSQKLQTEPLTGSQYLRISQWNLEGITLDRLAARLSHFGVNDLKLFNETDIFTLNSIGYYNEQSKFQDMIKHFAERYSANYIFAPEFLEASPDLLQERKVFEDFRGLSGNAIVSKYPILRAKIIRLPACYDWFVQEEQRLIYEPDEELKVKNRAGEGKLNLIRRGGRNALIADIELPNTDVITIVSSQLENRAESKCRQRQLESTLHYMKTFSNPVVYAVDLNNFGKSLAPTNFNVVLEKSAKEPKLYIKKIISVINPLNWLTSLTSITYGNFRKMGNPTVRHVPIILPNYSYRLFETIQDFEFVDGDKFDFSGQRELANSNERLNRNYTNTYEYKKLFWRSKIKLDWIFVKPVQQADHKHYFPKDALTLDTISLNQNQDTLSMHYPVTIKLMI